MAASNLSLTALAQVLTCEEALRLAKAEESPWLGAGSPSVSRVCSAQSELSFEDKTFEESESFLLEGGFGGQERGTFRSEGSGGVEGGFESFERRGHVWELRRSERLQRLRRLKELQELSKCTFQPTPQNHSTEHTEHTTQHATRHATSTRHAGEDARSPKPRKHFSASQSDALAARLCQPLPSEHMRAFHIRRLNDSVEAQKMSQCTFQPDISGTSLQLSLSRLREDWSSTHLESEGPKRPGRPGRARARRRTGSLGSLGSPHSLRPRTNPVPLSMARAQSYLGQNVFHRLHSERGPHKDHKDHNEHNEHKRSKSVEDSTSIADVSTGGAFLRFLERQNRCENVRRQRLERLDDEHNQHKNPEMCAPKMCKRSRQLCTAKNRRSDSERRSECRARSPQSPLSPSFRPQIHPASARRRSRGSHELSAGDWQRRELHVEELREALREMENQESFRPKLNVSNISGRLCLWEPETYTARLAADRERSLALREQELQRQMDEALAECTFHPAVNPGCPRYITRMAESHRALKELRRANANGANGANGAGPGSDRTERPDWR